MTFREPREKTMAARALTDPRPRFVSLVQAGANQTPIRSIKVDVVNTEDDLMATIAALKVKADGHEVKRITFKTGEQFPDEAAVRAFLEEGGYDASSLKATDDGFEVTNDENEFTDDVRSIEVGDDLTVEVGKLVDVDESELSEEEKAKALANKAGSAITDVKVTDAKKGEGAEGESTEKDDAAQKANEAAAEEANGDAGSAGATEDEDEEGATREGQLAAGIDGSLKPIRKRTKPGAAAEDNGDADATKASEGGTDEDAAKQTDAVECGPDEVFRDGKCVKTTAKVGDEVFTLLLDGEDVAGFAVPANSFEVTEKVELLSGDCGPGHTMISVGGRSFCVPTGDRTPISQDTEVSAPAAGGGQNAAGPGGTSPVSGQTQRSEDDEGSTEKTGENTVVLKVAKLEEGVVKTEDVAAKFDEFSAHFSDGLSLAEVMDDANDGFPPGLEMVILAAVMAMRNNFVAGNLDAVKQVGTDLGEAAAMLGSLFELIEREEDRRALVDRMSGQFADLGWPQAGEEGEEQNTNKGSDEGNEGPLTAVLTELTGAMKSIMSGLNEVKAKQDEQGAATADLTERVADVETRKQTKKGADDGDAGSAANVAKKSPIADLRLRSALGITQTAEDAR